MKPGIICRNLSFILCILFGQGSIDAQIPTVSAAPDSKIQPSDELNLIHFGDEIEVYVVGKTDYNWRGTLTPEGFLSGLTGLEDQVFGLCRNEDDVAREIARAYSIMLRDPKVVVRILDRSNRPNSTVLGAVKTQQRFLIKRPVYLNELIILSGGFTDQASGEIQIFRPASLNCEPSGTNGQSSDTNADKRERFIVARQENGSKYLNIRISDLLNGKNEANVQILAGDVVTVQEAKPIYVIGAVVNPRQIATRAEMTLSRAVAGAGGLSKDADAAKVTIFRRRGGETKIIEADLVKIKANQADDIVLQAFDIVDVGRKGNEKRKYPPVLNLEELGAQKNAKLPLRVIE